MRRAGLPVPPRHAARPGVLSWLARVMAVWVVLAGLFLMHGAASPAGGCQGGTAVTALAMPAVTPMPVMPAAALAGHAPGARPGHAACGGGMLCSARQPRGLLAGACAAATSGPAVAMAPAAPAFLAVASPRADRPPGRPGLPLPLFLGVSRT
jgi:hypothetical protein